MGGCGQGVGVSGWVGVGSGCKRLVTLSGELHVLSQLNPSGDAHGA